MFLFLLIVSVILWGESATRVCAQDEPLQGRVEEAGVAPTANITPRTIEPFPQPVLPRRARQSEASQTPALMPGSIEEFGGGLNHRQTDLNDPDVAGGVSSAESGLEVMEGRPEPQTGVLKGYATKEDANLSASADPDAADQELMIEWDRWRNRLLHAIQSGMQERLNNSGDMSLRWDPARQAMIAKFPLGTVAWFSCQVTPDRHVANVKLLRSSGFPGYDEAVIGSIKDLDGSSILRYPRGSRRQTVTQVAGIKTADTPGYRYYHFGDVERQVVPGYQ